MFTLAQPACHLYNPYQELAIQQELQRRRQIEAYLRRQRQAEETERRRREYEAAVRAEYERRRQVELERQRQAEFERRRAQQARGRQSMYDGGLESVFDALYGRTCRQAREEHQPTPVTRQSPRTTRTSSPVPTPTPTEPQPTPEPEQEDAQVDTAHSHAAVQSILSSFTSLQSEFTLPAQLDLQPGTSKLAYTSNNAPVHGYEHALTGLLTRLDAVESYGDDGVRRARKEAVKRIERELERLDGIKVEVWKRANESVEASEVDPACVPLPEDEDMQDEEMKDDFQTAVSEELSRPDGPRPEEPLERAEPDQTGSATPPEAKYSTSPQQPIDIVPIPASTPSTDAEPLDLEPIVSDNTESTLSLLRVPTPGPLEQSLPSEASHDDSDSDLELEEYVDVETMSTSENEGAGLERVEKDGDLELMHDWDLDF